MVLDFICCFRFVLRLLVVAYDWRALAFTNHLHLDRPLGLGRLWSTY